MQEFDKETLEQGDGKEGRKSIYIAYNGKVYDVSASKLWKNGEHMKRHHAGADLTAEFPAAPHGEEMFERVQQVGILPAGETAQALDDLPAWLNGLFRQFPMLRRHPHPMLVHYPIVFMFAAPVFSLLALLSGHRAFDTTAFHCLGAGLFFTPFTIASGLFTWWINYEARRLRPVTIKIWASAALTLLATLAFCWRFAEPDVLVTAGWTRGLYLLLICSLIPLVTTLGWFGASLTFPVGKS